jgi:transposase-like protein
MIDFPITDLMDDAACVAWLETHLHPDGFVCPHCRSSDRRLFRQQGSFPAYRCRACDGYYTLLTGTAFAKTRQAARALVLLIRGVAKGEATARLSRELALSRQQLGTLRKRVMHNLDDTAPTDMMDGSAFEADEVYQNAGEKKHAASQPD